MSQCCNPPNLTTSPAPPLTTRWKAIKTAFAKRIPRTETLSATRLAKEERGVWQRRYWEHTIQDEHDYWRHMDYLHINPVKHGLVERVADWRYSSFHKLVAAGVYAGDWAEGLEMDFPVGEAVDG